MERPFYCGFEADSQPNKQQPSLEPFPAALSSLLFFLFFLLLPICGEKSMMTWTGDKSTDPRFPISCLSLAPCLKRRPEPDRALTHEAGGAALGAWAALLWLCGTHIHKRRPTYVARLGWTNPSMTSYQKRDAPRFKFSQHNGLSAYFEIDSIVCCPFVRVEPSKEIRLGKIGGQLWSTPFCLEGITSYTRLSLRPNYLGKSSCQVNQRSSSGATRICPSDSFLVYDIRLYTATWRKQAMAKSIDF